MDNGFILHVTDAAQSLKIGEAYSQNISWGLRQTEAIDLMQSMNAQCVMILFAIQIVLKK